MNHPKQIPIMKCSFLLLCLLPLFASAKDGERVEKKITREFNITANGRFTVNNKYGAVDIAIGESNKIKVLVTIIVEASNTKKAQERLDRIGVNFTEGNNRVDAKTQIESSSSWTSWFGSDNAQMEINYQVFVPADIYLELRNEFGNIYLERTDRDVLVDIGYGDLRLGDINAKLNLDMAFSDGSMSMIRQGDLNLEYSDLEMEDSQTIDIDMQYSDLEMGSSTRMNLTSQYSDMQGMDVDEIMYNGKFDDMHIDRTKKIVAESEYSGINLSGLDLSGEFDMQFGNLAIDNIGRSFSKIDLKTSYTGVELTFAPGTAFTVDADVQYCDIQHKGLKVSEDIERHTSKSLKASRGSGGGLVYARMQFGELIIE
jgi:Tfp pilus assembly protein PilZ